MIKNACLATFTLNRQSCQTFSLHPVCLNLLLPNNNSTTVCADPVGTGSGFGAQTAEASGRTNFKVQGKVRSCPGIRILNRLGARVAAGSLQTASLPSLQSLPLDSCLCITLTTKRLRKKQVYLKSWPIQRPPHLQGFGPRPPGLKGWTTTTAAHQL